MNSKLIAKEKGYQAYKDGKKLKDNDYQHYSNKNGAIALMAYWDVGWKMAELEEQDPERYKELIGG